MSITLLDLGRRQYAEVWDLQRRLVEERSSGLAQDTLILVEHDHVITLGRKTTDENFRPQDVPVFQVERGGDATYHGPGQLVGYPIIKMDPPDVRRFVRSLEEVLIRTTSSFSIPAERKEGHPGVWVGEKKLASIGVAVTNWVTYHGFALNVNTDMSYFHLIKPCGLDPETMTSMRVLLGGPVEFEAVKVQVKRDFADVFGVALVEAQIPVSGTLRSTGTAKIK
ncbi:MAG: lipoyl(octanoyl) transferase LipB [Thaumarchaeota archaeon]|nr:lipoyl(octanoyl) transferase LipB [Nitrososphaerota archaeon]